MVGGSTGESGVDVYLVVDVSGSIDEAAFNTSKAFLKALIPNVGRLLFIVICLPVNEAHLTSKLLA